MCIPPPCTGSAGAVSCVTCASATQSGCVRRTSRRWSEVVVGSRTTPGAVGREAPGRPEDLRQNSRALQGNVAGAMAARNHNIHPTPQGRASTRCSRCSLPSTVERRAPGDKVARRRDARRLPPGMEEFQPGIDGVAERPRDPKVDEAKIVLARLFSEEAAEVYDLRQIAVRLEKTFFHWITGKALPEL
jgi:hypothetical protein